METLLISIISLAALGLLSGLLLGYASQKFAVILDPKVEEIAKALPGVNCGVCGFGGCHSLAEAIVAGKADINTCPVGGTEAAKVIAWILGVEAKITEPQVVVMACGGGKSSASQRFEYSGIKTCQAAVLVAQGEKACLYGCLGFGDCVTACPFGAIKLNAENLPVIDPKKCTACGKCIKACPRKLFELVPSRSRYLVKCLSKDKGAVVRKICKVGCIACNLCVKECHFEAICIADNLAYIDQKKCTHCGACIKVCPTKCIVELYA